MHNNPFGCLALCRDIVHLSSHLPGGKARSLISLSLPPSPLPSSLPPSPCPSTSVCTLPRTPRSFRCQHGLAVCSSWVFSLACDENGGYQATSVHAGCSAPIYPVESSAHNIIAPTSLLPRLVSKVLKDGQHCSWNCEPPAGSMDEDCGGPSLGDPSRPEQLVRCRRG